MIMASQKKKKPEDIDQADIGGALMAWYAEAIKEYPEGLVSQAQAATMLGISRVSLGRLVTRGHLRAVYFPAQPDVIGLSVTEEDSTWLKILGWLGKTLGETEHYVFPKACYVAFTDVKRLWEKGEARDKCKSDWKEIMAAHDSEKLKPILDEKRIVAMELEIERLKRSLDDGGTSR